MFYGEIDANSLSLDQRELAARLSTAPGDIPEGFDMALARLLPCVNIAYSAVECESDIRDSRLFIDGKEVASAALLRVLSGSSHVLLLTVTLGLGSERYLRGASALSVRSHFLTDAAADTLVEAAADEAESRLTGERAHTARFSPGYADLPLEYVDEIVRRTDAARLLGVRVLPTHLVIPAKTVTAIIGIKD